MDIHQLSVAYIKEQDRLLLRINATTGEELRLWFTQRMTRGLVPHLHKVVMALDASDAALADQSEASKQLLSEFKKDEVLQTADFKTPYKAAAKALPLGAEPLLVTEVRLTPLAGGKLQIAFDEKLADTTTPRGFKIAVESPLMHGFMHLLETAIGNAEWPITVPAGLAGTGGAADVRDDVTARPKYLN